MARMLMEKTGLQVLTVGEREYLVDRKLRLRADGSWSAYTFVYEQRDGKLVEIDLPGVLPD